jgi:kynurenine formamidase
MDASGVMHFPGFSEEAAKFLTEERNINGIGIDTLSLDYGPSPDFIVHVIMLKAGKWQLENLANLGKLPAKGAYIIAAPMLIKDGSGAPTRVLAILP